MSVKNIKIISQKDFRLNLTDHIDAVYSKSEELIITNNGRPKVKVIGLSEKEIQEFKIEN